MAQETGTYISDLVAANPVDATDTGASLGGQVRFVKSAVKATFPNISGAVTPTHTELNYVDGVTSAIQTQLDAKAAVAQAVATAATLVNSWADQGGAYQVCEFWKDTTGQVHIHGVIKSGSTGTVAFTLPAGSRPAAQQTFALPLIGGGVSAYAYADIAASGTVTITFSGPTIFSLCGITFRAA